MFGVSCSAGLRGGGGGSRVAAMFAGQRVYGGVGGHVEGERQATGFLLRSGGRLLRTHWKEEGLLASHGSYLVSSELTAMQPKMAAIVRL